MTRKKPRWISKKALLLLHELSLAQFGGARGLRDDGLLESALARPHNAYLYSDKSTLTELAASYAYGLTRNQAFVDGNKRAAFLSIGLFLAVNGLQLTAPQVEAIDVMLALARGDLEEAALAEWIARHCSPRTD